MFRVPIVRKRARLGQFRVPEKPTFLGFLTMVSIYKSLETSVFWARGRVSEVICQLPNSRGLGIFRARASAVVSG